MKYLSLLLALSILSGCGGTRMLWFPKPLDCTAPLSIASDRHLSAQLKAVIFRDGPGSWAKNADWDEYIIGLQNISNDSLQITGITVVDSLVTRVARGDNRRKLVLETKKAKRRYKGQRLRVRAGLGPGAILGTGVLLTAWTASLVGLALQYYEFLIANASFW